MENLDFTQKIDMPEQSSISSIIVTVAKENEKKTANEQQMPLTVNENTPNKTETDDSQSIETRSAKEQPVSREPSKSEDSSEPSVSSTQDRPQSNISSPIFNTGENLGETLTSISGISDFGENITVNETSPEEVQQTIDSPEPSAIENQIVSPDSDISTQESAAESQKISSEISESIKQISSKIDDILLAFNSMFDTNRNVEEQTDLQSQSQSEQSAIPDKPKNIKDYLQSPISDLAKDFSKGILSRAKGLFSDDSQSLTVQEPEKAQGEMTQTNERIAKTSEEGIKLEKKQLEHSQKMVALLTTMSSFFKKSKYDESEQAAESRQSKLAEQIKNEFGISDGKDGKGSGDLSPQSEEDSGMFSNIAEMIGLKSMMSKGGGLLKSAGGAISKGAGGLYSAATGGLGIGGLMSSGAGTALSGGLGAGAAVTSGALVVGAAVGGFAAGDAIAEKTGVGIYGWAKDSEKQADQAIKAAGSEKDDLKRMKLELMALENKADAEKMKSLGGITGWFRSEGVATEETLKAIQDKRKEIADYMAKNKKTQTAESATQQAMAPEAATPETNLEDPIKAEMQKQDEAAQANEDQMNLMKENTESIADEYEAQKAKFQIENERSPTEEEDMMLRQQAESAIRSQPSDVHRWKNKQHKPCRQIKQ
jgi:hypothetical protein